MAAGESKTIPSAVLISVAVVVVALAIMAIAHEGHYRERRLQMLEHKVEGLEKILSGRHGRTA